MLLDDVNGLRNLHNAFDAFLRSSDFVASFPAHTNGTPAPYDEFLLGLRVNKGGDKQLRISADRWLELSGELADLESFKKQLLVPKDGDHQHWYDSPISLIIEADDSWIAENEPSRVGTFLCPRGK